MTFENILVPYDGSKYSNNAYMMALNLAKRYGSKITVLTCLNVLYEGGWYVDRRISDQQLKKQKKSVQKEFEKLKSLANNDDVSFNSEILPTLHVVKALVNYAKTKKIDLVVMGSHGRTGWDKLLLGTVSNGVVQRVHCPVLIMK